MNRTAQPARVSSPQRGAAILLVMLVVTISTLLLSTMMDSVVTDMEAAGAERRAEDAMYAAEAGIAWAMQELQVTHGYDGSADFTSTLTALTASSATSDAPTAVTAVGNYQLHPSYRTFGSAEYRVVAALDPSDSANKRLRLRSYGRIKIAGNVKAQRLLEVIIGEP